MVGLVRSSAETNNDRGAKGIVYSVSLGTHVITRGCLETWK